MNYSLKSLRSAGWVWGGTFVGTGSTFIFQAIAIRIFGIEEYGVFSFMVSLSIFLSLISGFGMPQSILKINATKVDLVNSFIKVSFRVTLLLSALCFFILFGVLGYKNGLVDGLIYSIILIFFIASQSIWELAGAKLQIDARFKFYGAWLAGPAIIRLVLFAAFIMIGQNGIVQSMSIYGLVGLLVIVTSWIFLQKGKNIVNNNCGIVWADVLGISKPYFAASICAFIYTQGAVILLGLMSDSINVSLFGIAFLIFSALSLMPSVVFQKVLAAKYHLWSIEDISKLRRMYDFSRKQLFLFGVVVYIFLLFFAELLIGVFFGDGYSEVCEILLIMSISLPFYFMSFNSGAILLTRSFIYLKIRIMAFLAVLFLILSLIILPEYGAMGAASIFSLISISQFFIYGYYADKFFKQEK